MRDLAVERSLPRALARTTACSIGCVLVLLACGTAEATDRRLRGRDAQVKGVCSSTAGVRDWSYIEAEAQPLDCDSRSIDCDLVDQSGPRLRAGETASYEPALPVGIADADLPAADSAAPSPLAKPVSYRDSAGWSHRLKTWRRVPLLSVVDTRRLSVFLGVDRRGRPGLHFESVDPARDDRDERRDWVRRLFAPDDGDSTLPPGNTPAPAFGGRH